VPALRTERLVLREWREQDREPFAALNSDPAVMQYYPALLTRAESDAALDRIQAHFAREGFGLWALESATAPLLGFAGLARSDLMPGVVEIGWRLARRYWGQGFTTEAATAAARWGFEALALREIVAFVVPTNLRSQRVMARLGMKRDPAASFAHPHIPDGHPMQWHWLFRLAAPAPAAPEAED